jgi:hypothetical protein
MPFGPQDFMSQQVEQKILEVMELLQQDPDPAAAERAGTLTQRCELSATA